MPQQHVKVCRSYLLHPGAAAVAAARNANAIGAGGAFRCRTQQEDVSSAALHEQRAPVLPLDGCSWLPADPAVGGNVHMRLAATRQEHAQS